MTTLVWLWLLSLAVIIGLFFRGFVRAKMTPVSYQFNWSPVTFVTTSLFPKGRVFWARTKVEMERSLHRLFHVYFHQMKRFHDRVFGKRIAQDQGTPSFFLKTIAEHKDILTSDQKTDRQNGLS